MYVDSKLLSADAPSFTIVKRDVSEFSASELGWRASAQRRADSEYMSCKKQALVLVMFEFEWHSGIFANFLSVRPRALLEACCLVRRGAYPKYIIWYVSRQHGQGSSSIDVTIHSNLRIGRL